MYKSTYLQMESENRIDNSKIGYSVGCRHTLEQRKMTAPGLGTGGIHITWEYKKKGPRVLTVLQLGESIFQTKGT